MGWGGSVHRGRIKLDLASLRDLFCLCRVGEAWVRFSL